MEAWGSGIGSGIGNLPSSLSPGGEGKGEGGRGQGNGYGNGHGNGHGIGSGGRGYEMRAAISSEMTVNQVLQQYPATLPIFNQYRVDACCGGGATLAVAAAAAGVPVDELVAALAASAPSAA